MENCKNCKYVKEEGCFDVTWYKCALTNNYVNFPRLMDGSKKCVCYKRVEKIKDKFIYPVLEDLESYLQSIGEIQGDLF